MYQITHLGDDDDEPEFSSGMAAELDEGETFFFHARDLQNLVLVDEMESLAPIMSCQVSPPLILYPVSFVRQVI